MRRVGLAVAIVAAVALAVGALGLAHLLRKPIVPPVIIRGADARRILSPGVVAHIERIFSDRLPGDRSKSPRLIALTFDDGPYPVETPLLLDELAALHVPATFFLIGDDATLYPDLTRRIEADGNEIANHTQTHPAFFNRLGGAEVRTELVQGARTLERYVHDPSIERLMRPPHGRFTLATVEAAQRAGYDVVLWHDDPGDWRLSVLPQTIVSHAAAHATAPEIMLLHSGRLATIEALPELVARYRRAGFRFVTAGTLLRDVPLVEIDHPKRFRV